MISSLLVFQYGQARIWFAMSRDRLLPGIFSRVHPIYKTPHISTWIAGFVVGIPAGIWDIGTFADLSNIGTLFAFIVVSAGVIVLRRKQPERPRGFRVPWSPSSPLLSIALLPAADDGPAARDLDALLRLAGNRPDRLHPLRRQTHRRRLGARPRETIIGAAARCSMTILKLTSIGTSVGTVIPKEMLTRMKVGKGDTLYAIETTEGYLLTPYDPEDRRST